MRFRQSEAGGYRWLTNPNDVYIGRSLDVYGEWSFGEIELLTRHLADDATVVEVGANVGAHTVPLARHVARGKVIAFEPQRIAFQLLCANAVGNDCANVFARNEAVGAEPGTAHIPEIDPFRTFNFGGVQVVRSGGGTPVPLVTLDEALEAESSVALIKCDAEGMETEVLLGAAETVRRHRPLLYLEDDRTAHSQALYDAARALDYDVWWHAVPLFRPDNIAGVAENIFKNIYSMSLFCADAALGLAVPGLTKLRSFADHPMAGKIS